MAQYIINALVQTAAGNYIPLAGADITHSRENCTHSNVCTNGNPDCEDRPSVPGDPGAREGADVVTRTTGGDGIVIFSFPGCSGKHNNFVGEYQGQQPADTERYSGGKVIFFRFQPPDYGAGLPPVGGQQLAHACFFPTKTTGKPCRRRTKDAYCYQHMKAPTPAMKEFAGTWMMNGRQTVMLRFAWEAELVLEANGELTWKETKGGNVGARREGYWDLDGPTLRMRYLAPGVGLADWVAQEPKPTHMSGTYRTPDVDPKGAGWGGEWSATKVTA